ncbi:MAG: division/cell wall cluster transcriptional repressor MraZ [Oscillospiraceae bacterium]|nr:division/cell wall cluster transcriptional repressor MraZ [Oscillospiraceae bacterium]
MMIGTYQHTVDAKGRMFVPAPLRKQLGEEFYVTITGERCLQIYSLEMWQRALEKLSAMPQKNQRTLRQLFASAAHCVPDGQGRIPLPQDLRDYAGLSKNVTIVGTGLYAQIWDSEAYKPIQDIERSAESINEALEELDF